MRLPPLIGMAAHPEIRRGLRSPGNQIQLITMAPLLEIAAPLALLAAAAVFFFSLARQAATADPERQRRARSLTGTAREAVVGSVGWRANDLLSGDVDCGMGYVASSEKTVIVRQARLTHDSISSI